MKKIIAGIIFISQITLLIAQDSFNVEYHGYINWTAIYDSRQTVSAREGHFLLYPKGLSADAFGKDINAVPNLNFSVIQTRVSSKVTTPTFLGAKTYGLIEAEFMGNSEADVNGFRLRHAFINLDWGSTSLLIGQTWIPMFITEAFPQQIGSNGGAPFQPFGRNPQIRLTQKFGSISLIGTMMTQRDYVSPGPNGSSSEYMRNSTLPDFNLQVRYNIPSFLVGISGQFKKLRPSTVSELNHYTDETVSGYSFMAFTKITTSNFNFLAEGVYGTNLADYTMLGGYAVKSTDPVTKVQKYEPLKTYSVWTDFSYNNFFIYGLFLGYTENLGSTEQVENQFFARGSNIKSIYRIAPRISFKHAELLISLEYELTAAAYGIPNQKGVVENTTNFKNNRVYTSVYYFF